MKKHEVFVCDISANINCTEEQKILNRLSDWELVAVVAFPLYHRVYFKREISIEPPAPNSGVQALVSLLHRADVSPDGTAQITKEELQALNDSLSGPPRGTYSGHNLSLGQ